jgi:hypothetical protein
MKYKGKLKKFRTVQLKFNCRPLSNDLLKYQYNEFKSGKVGIPKIIVEKILRRNHKFSSD